MGRLMGRLLLAAAMVASGLLHADLYVHGYRHIPVIGTAFLIQASVFGALGLLIAVGAPQWFGWVSGVLSAGALVAFGLSRTTGLFGFVEQGLEPVPYALLAVLAEAAAVLLVGVRVVLSRRIDVGGL